MLSAGARIVVMLLLLPYQAICSSNFEMKAIDCQCSFGGSCTLDLRIISPPDANLTRVDYLNWYKYSVYNGEQILRYSGSDVNYSPGYSDERFKLDTADGSLTISNAVTEDEVKYCFSGSFDLHDDDSSSNTADACAKAVVIVPVAEVQLCSQDSSGISQCVSRSGSGSGSDTGDDVNVTVVSGSDVQLRCKTLTCVKPAAVFKWSIGPRLLSSDPSTNTNCNQAGLQTSTSVISLSPRLGDHTMKLTCNVSNQNYAEGGVAVGFRLNVNVPVDANKLEILQYGDVYQSGGVLSVREGQWEEVRCRVTGTRPSADISWVLADSFFSSKRLEARLSEGLYDTTGILDFKVTNSMNVIRKLVCVAKTNDMKQAVTIAVSLLVERRESSWARVVGLTLGILGLVALFLVVVALKKRRKKQKRRNENAQVSTIRLQDRNPVPTPPMVCSTVGDSCVFVGPPVSKRPCVYPDTSDGNSRYVTLPASQPFPRSKLSLMNPIGQGNFGLVYLASASDILQSESQTYVALKTLKENAGRDVRENMLREVDLMRRMTPHPNVVRYLGSCLEKEPLYVIVEYLSNGNLQQYLRQNRSKDYTYIDACNESLCCSDLIKCARDIAKGMAFLSSNKCIHNDLAARNVLVTGDKVCKISDFGLACDWSNAQCSRKRTDNALPLRWMALESLDNNVFTTKSDVWSFGIVLWEIVTFGARPYPNMAVRDVIAKLREGYRMPKPIHCDEKFYDIMLGCWDAGPDRRPSFAELVNSLESFLETEADYIVVGLYEEALYLTPNGDDSKHHEKMESG